MYRDFYLCLIRENIEDRNFAIEFPSYCINANRNKNEEKLRVNQVKNQFAYFGCILKHVKIEF